MVGLDDGMDDGMDGGIGRWDWMMGWVDKANRCFWQAKRHLSHGALSSGIRRLPTLMVIRQAVTGNLEK